MPRWAWLRKNRGSFDREPEDKTQSVEIVAEAVSGSPIVTSFWPTPAIPAIGPGRSLTNDRRRPQPRLCPDGRMRPFHLGERVVAKMGKMLEWKPSPRCALTGST